MLRERKEGCGEMVLRERGRREEGDAVRGGCAHVGARAVKGKAVRKVACFPPGLLPLLACRCGIG